MSIELYFYNHEKLSNFKIKTIIYIYFFIVVETSTGSQHLYDSQRYEERRVPEEDLYYNSRPNTYKDHKR